MSSFQKLYQAVYIQVAKHIELLVEKISTTTHINFLQLKFTHLLIKVFTSLLSFLATLYEFISYCCNFQISYIIP